MRVQFIKIAGVL